MIDIKKFIDISKLYTEFVINEAGIDWNEKDGPSKNNPLTILDPQPRGYGMDQGKVIIKRGDTYYQVDVSKERDRLMSDQKAYLGSSLPGYEYDPENPQAPQNKNADAVYFPVADVKTAPSVDNSNEPPPNDPANGDIPPVAGPETIEVTTQDQANSIFQNPDSTDAERAAAREFYGATTTPKQYNDIGAAMIDRDNVEPGDEVVIDSEEAIVVTNDNDEKYYVDPNGKPIGELPQPDAQTTVDSPSGDTSGGDSGVNNNATTDPEVNQTPPGALAQPDADDTPSIDTDDGGVKVRGLAPAAQEPAAQEPAQPAAPSNGSLLGRKLDTTTPNLMKAYNDGGKQAMPTIRNMQTALSRLGFDPNGLDGKYGPGTFKAVQEFQKANGLSVDGQAGPSTMAAIKKALDDNFENNKVTPAASAQAAAPRSNASDDPAETGSTGAQPRANSAVNTRADAPTVQTASKDNNMNKNKINEASMNISMNGNDASEVADLVKLLQNAGMPQAGPVSDIPMPMPKALPTPHDHDSHDNMKSMMTLMNEPEDAPCGEDCGCDSCATEDTSEYDAAVSEWDNSPEEEYSNISAVLPDGDDLHKSKKPYPAVDGGDNAMALESIKEQLWAALNEKTTVEGRGRGKKTLKASRGNEDIKTTEGSRGKKSRGKKSRG